jgi:hypothetical protein
MGSVRRLGYRTECLTCEEAILRGERAVREAGVGAWHEDCGPPANLTRYLRDRERRDRARRPEQRRQSTRG